MKKGWSSVAHMMACPTAEAALPTGAAMRAAKPIPASTVTMGVTRMSILVSLLTALPSSAARMVTNSTASGPPAPPMELVAKPTGIRGEQHQRRGLQRPADGYRHAGAHHGGAQAADGVGHGPLALADGDDALRQEADVQLRPQSVEDGAHQQGCRRDPAP